MNTQNILNTYLVQQKLHELGVPSDMVRIKRSSSEWSGEHTRFPDDEDRLFSTDPEERLDEEEEMLAPYYQSGELVKSNVCNGYYSVRNQSKTKGFVVETRNSSLASLYLEPNKTSHEWRTGSVFGWTKPRGSVKESKSGRPEWQRTCYELRGRPKEEFRKFISLVIE
jgi:hypothetical protein